MPSAAFLKAIGLNTQPNQLSAPEGSLIQASNVIIHRDNVVEPRRGFTQYGETFGTSTDRAKQLMEYQNALIRHYNNILQWDTGILDPEGLTIWNTFAGNFLEPTPGLRIKWIEYNKNLYFTTSDGIQKISATSSNNFSPNSGYIIPAGVPQALDVSTQLVTSYGNTTGFLPQDSTVAYRVVWGYTDANGLELLGAPSSRSVIYNSLLTTNISDLNALLYQLDQLNVYGSFFQNADYVSNYSLTNNSTALNVYDSLTGLVNELDLEEGILFSGSITAVIASGVCTLTLPTYSAVFGKVQIGDVIYLSGFAPTGLNGPQTVVSVSDNGTNSFITFNTTQTGTVTVSSPTITSGWFRNITVPTAPATPATDQDLTNLQTYLLSIIQELQSARNVLIDSSAYGITPQQYPLDILSASATAPNTLTITFDVTGVDIDARNVYQVGDLINLDGLWSYTGTPTNLDGTYSVTNVTSNTVVITINGLTTGGTVTLNTTSTMDRILRYTDAIQSEYLSELTITTSANVIVSFVIPPGITTNYFYQIYRSAITTATGTDVLDTLYPNDEMTLVYEGFPTEAQILSGTISVTDVVPDSFSQGTTELYTNEISGEGILQSNNPPPLAQDINIFKNYVWYANTQTLQTLSLSLLGVSNIITDYNNNLNPSLVIATDTGFNRYNFIEGVQQITTVITNAGSTLASSGAASYFTIFSGNNATEYYIWYAVGTATDPMVPGAVGIKIYATSTDTADQVAQQTVDGMSVNITDFTVSGTSDIVTITNLTEGVTDDASPGTSGFSITTPTPGNGQSVIPQVTTITTVAGNLYLTSGTADYFTLNTPFDQNLYLFWFNVAGGSMTEPTLPNYTSIPIDVTTLDTADQVASLTSTAILGTGGFTTNVVSNVITVTNINNGPATYASNHVANGGFSVTTSKPGALNVLLSDNISPALAVQETAQSLDMVINENNSEVVSAFYTSDISGTPGQFTLQAKDLSTGFFYVLGNTTNVGVSFSQPITPTNFITSISVADPTVITSVAHGLENGDEIVISGSNSFPIIDGVWVVSNCTTNTFTIPEQVTTAGTAGAFILLSDANTSTDDVRPNRIFYSKLQQAEAVPLLNYIDIGSANKAILRIFPLRDSLFIFKEDGLFRISGETPPWTLNLFDATTIITAPDSLGTINNLVYSWCQQGITSVSEAGVRLISRAIDLEILPIVSDLYPSFYTATWGTGYQSDNAYYVYTTNNQTDTEATIAYRYSSLTSSWTTADLSNTCGLVKSTDDKLYMGDGVSNQLVVERKNFDRTDYADKQYTIQLNSDSYFNGGLTLQLSDITNVGIGDVLTQEQTVNIYTFNQLLQKLDLDVQITNKNYFSSFQLINGGNLRTQLQDLAIGLDNDLTVGQVKTFTPSEVNTGTSTITIASHGYTDGTPMMLYSSGVLPSPLTNGTFYFIVNATTNTFQLSTLYNGSPITITTQGTGLHTIHKAVYEYAIIDQISYPIVNNSVANPTVITSPGHGLTTGRIITITDVVGSVPSINGIYTVTVIDSNTFSIPVDVVTEGTGGNFTTNVSDFNDILVCYNNVISELNSDPNTAFKNYQPSNSNSLIEVIVLSINTTNDQIGVALGLPYIVGPLTLYKNIDSVFTYSPLTLQDPVSMKQLSESTIMFQDKTFTTAILSFSTDLFPEFQPVPFMAYGSGLFGHDIFGQNYFGGNSHSAPFRTYIPMQCQRCRYLNIKFEHAIAREKYSIYGISITGRSGLSSRAYRS
jgi:hypothetical protein